MGVVGTVAFGVDFHTQDVDESEISEAAKELIASAQALFTQNREHLLSTHILLVLNLAQLFYRDKHWCFAAFGGNLYAMLVLLFPFALPILKPIARIFPDAQMRKVRVLHFQALSARA